MNRAMSDEEWSLMREIVEQVPGCSVGTVDVGLEVRINDHDGRERIPFGRLFSVIGERDVGDAYADFGQGEVRIQVVIDG
ncbi:hypothetical protein [Natronorarus salvus]|uniref:hypothetical protein n=1 Tax=Natronorarus salvus TaxID=3117733 RepID=UPI002F263788